MDNLETGNIIRYTR